MKCDHDGGNCWAPECASSSCEMRRILEGIETQGYDELVRIIRTPSPQLEFSRRHENSYCFAPPPAEVKKKAGALSRGRSAPASEGVEKRNNPF